MKRRPAVEQISLEEISELLCDSLAQGQEVVLNITGNSMYPLLRHGRDKVILRAAQPEEMQLGDVPLYRRENGQYVLHRIVERDDGDQRTLLADSRVYPSMYPGGGLRYTMLGDAQTELERGVLPSQILAVAVGFYRRGKRMDVQSAAYRRRVLRWHRLLPLRGYWLVVRALPGRAKRWLVQRFRLWTERFHR